MSNAVQPPPVAPAPPRRPVTVQVAAALLVVMAAAGLVYAIATLAIVPGVLDEFRDAASGTAEGEVDTYATLVWVLAVAAAVIAVILAVVFPLLAINLRRGSVPARITTWVFCGLGVLFGCISLSAVTGQRMGEGVPGSAGFALSEAYPGGWIALNMSLAGAQMIGYLAVAILVAVGTRNFFGRQRVPVHPSGSGAFVALPTYGSANTYTQASPTQAAGTSQPAAPPPSPGPDDDYWSRPSS